MSGSCKHSRELMHVVSETPFGTWYECVCGMKEWVVAGQLAAYLRDREW